jgi:anaerobic magnesium-protoporphyrin IX monomethyl ester cyclase
MIKKCLEKNTKIALLMVIQDKENKVLPFPLMFLGGALKRAGYTVEIFHITPDEIDKTVEYISKNTWLFVGISVITGLITYYSLEISKKIKDKNKDLKIVWGGVHPSILPLQTLEEESIDIVVINDGEECSIELADAFINKKDLRNIEGIGFKQNNKKIINKERVLNLKLERFPIDFSLINIEDYIIMEEVNENGKKREIKSLGYYGSRGCPHNCGFCYNLNSTRRKWRPMSEDIVIKDINFLKEKYNIEKIHFWDDNFFVDKERAYRILKAINIYSGIEIRLDYITEEVAKNLKKFKVNFCLIGLESGSNRMLKLINKNFTVKEAYDKIEILSKYKINVLYSLILGLPSEKLKETYETIDFAYTIFKRYNNISFTIGIYLPYPGTSLYEDSKKLGFIVPKTIEEWSLIDRWKNNFELPWFDNKIALVSRHLFSLLILYKDNFLIKKWLGYRIQKKIFNFDLDFKLIAIFIIYKNKLSKFVQKLKIKT